MNTSITSYSRALLANESWKINATGSAIRGIVGTAVYTIEPQGMNALYGFATGLGVTFKDSFDHIIITNSASPQTVTVWIGDGLIDDNRIVGNVDVSGGIEVSGTIRNAGNVVVEYGADTLGTSASLIKGADSKRSSILIKNNSAFEIYIGSDSSVTASNGMPISAGGSATFTFQATVYGISTDASTNIRFIDEGTTA